MSRIILLWIKFYPVNLDSPRTDVIHVIHETMDVGYGVPP